MMLLGYAITASVLFSLAAVLVLAGACRKEIWKVVSKDAGRADAVAIMMLLIFFVVFLAVFVHPVEQLYFDENIYQGIALNILSHANALWCQYGTGYLKSCFANQVYHDPAGWPVFIAIAFAIFGIGIGTAYALQVLVGALSVFGVFLLAGSITENRQAGIISALVFSLVPEVLIWSRTEASIDTPFMMLSVFSFLFFVVFMKQSNKRTFALFAFCTALAVYSRLEAALLIPIFLLSYIVFGEGRPMTVIGTRLRNVWNAVNYDAGFLLIALLVVAVLFTQVYYISIEASAPSYGQTGNNLFSFKNLMSNGKTNILYLMGYFNSSSYYPAVFPVGVTILAITGAILLAVDRKEKGRLGVLIMLLAWILSYFLFYGFFYAGGATFGVDSRFMLEITPGLAILAGIGITKAGKIAEMLTRNKRVGTAVCAAIIAVLVVFPFVELLPITTMPTGSMPQQPVPLGAVSFIQSNYMKVPSDCLVFSFTPDVWYELNRSAAQISYLGDLNQSSRARFSCFVLDYGYWCAVPPYNTGTCASAKERYDLKTLAIQPASNGAYYALYQIMNYT